MSGLAGNGPISGGQRTQGRLSLTQVTLCAATSVNVAATVHALEKSLARVDFADCILFTDATITPPHPSIRTLPISQLNSAQAYSRFLLANLADHIETSHCLVIQWDGHVLDPQFWNPAFLDYDYIGASWPQFADSHNVGNGGFSLRSRGLLQACQTLRYDAAVPEDVVISRVHREWLEERGLRFAPCAVADRFSAERAGDVLASFGYHGVWHMPRILGVAGFWEIYRTLDERSTVRNDIVAVLRQVVQGSGGAGRGLRLLADCLGDAIMRGN